MATRATKEEALRRFVDWLRGRSNKEIDYATAKFPRDGHTLEWVDYVRGKDLMRVLRAHPELLQQQLQDGGGGAAPSAGGAAPPPPAAPAAGGGDAATAPPSTQQQQQPQPQQQPQQLDDAQAQQLLQQLVRARLLLPADRHFKRAKPGKQRLVKWPRTLDPLPMDQLADAPFLVFVHDKPTGPWLYVGAALIVVAVLGATLFPLAPHWVRLGVLYGLTALLSLLVGAMALRYVLFLPVWLLTGAHFWLWPRMMDDTVPITQIFSPLLSYAARDPRDKASTPAARLAVAALIAAACYLLHAVGPDAAAVKTGLQDAHDGLLGYFDLVGGMKAGLGNGSDSTPGINLTSAAAGAAAGGDDGGAGAAAAGGGGGDGDAGGSSGGGGGVEL